MTEPIAVDVPAKPLFSRSGPGPTQGPSPTPAPAPTPTAPPAPVPKVEAPKLAPIATAVVAVATTAATGAPAPVAAGFLAQFRKKQLVVGAVAALSLFAGIGAVRMMFPAKDDAQPPAPVTAAVDDKVKFATPPAAKPPAPEVETPRTLSALPPLPTFPAAPVGGPPPAINPTGIYALPPSAAPTIAVEPQPVVLPPIPNFTAPPPPTGVVPAAFPAMPPTPPAVVPTPPAPGAGLPPLPALPAAPPSGLAPPSVDLPLLPAPGGVAPPVIPKAADPVFPPIPGGVGAPPLGTLPPVPEVKPAFPDVKPPAAVAPPVGVTPHPFPVGVGPKTDVKPPAFDPPALGTPTGFTKPAGASDAKPIAPEFAPKTTFDVDVHDPKANDTYETISLEFYNDKRFATALKAFNQNQPLQGGRYVNVPPIHVLKRQFPTQAGGAVVPVGASGAPSSDPVWGAVPKPAARNTFTVPQGGMTLRQIARQALGNEQRWSDIYDLNPQITKPSDLLPAGTELKLP